MTTLILSPFSLFFPPSSTSSPPLSCLSPPCHYILPSGIENPLQSLKGQLSLPLLTTAMSLSIDDNGIMVSRLYGSSQRNKKVHLYFFFFLGSSNIVCFYEWLRVYSFIFVFFFKVLLTYNPVSQYAFCWITNLLISLRSLFPGWVLS